MYFVSGKYRKSLLEVYLRYIIIVFETVKLVYFVGITHTSIHSIEKH